MTTVAIVPAAGKGRRMGADKALLDLGGLTAIERIAGALEAAGIDELVVVRNREASLLPAVRMPHRVLFVTGDGDMADSLRAAERALPDSCKTVVVLPVDHALVEADTIAATVFSCSMEGASIARPSFRGRPGHPVAMRRVAFAAIREPGVVLRDIVRRDPSATRDVPTSNPWTIADLDSPEDLAEARASLLSNPGSVVGQMLRHRSHRSFSGEPLAKGQLERIVDAARHASTSSFIQAYSVVVVEEASRRRAVAELCADQKHVAEAPVFAAVCADLHKIAQSCRAHGQSIRSDSLELFLQATVDAALMGQNLAIAAESEGLGICMIGAARNHPIEIASLLGLPAHCYVVFGMAIGKPTDDPVARGRMPLAGVLHRETYDLGSIQPALDGADAGMRDWARRCNERGGYQGRPVSVEKGWTDRMAQLWGTNSAAAKSRSALASELRRLGFGLE